MPLTKLQEAALNGDEAEWIRLKSEQTYQEVVNSPVRKPGLGTIRKFFPNRGFGFIKPDIDGLDVWIHVNHCVEGYRPEEGDKVIYLTRLGKEGLVAKEVERIELVTECKPISTNKVDTLREVNKQFEANMGGFNQPICQEIQKLNAEVSSRHDRGTPEMYGKRS